MFLCWINVYSLSYVFMWSCVPLLGVWSSLHGFSLSVHEDCLSWNLLSGINESSSFFLDSFFPQNPLNQPRFSPASADFFLNFCPEWMTWKIKEETLYSLWSITMVNFVLCFNRVRQEMRPFFFWNDAHSMAWIVWSMDQLLPTPPDRILGKICCLAIAKDSEFPYVL